MGLDCIYNIDLTTNNKDIISISSDNFNHFYIANIDDDGNEVSYKVNKKNNILNANFFMIKVIKSINPESNLLLDRLFKRKDIVKIGISFTSGKYQEFNICKNRIVKNGIMENDYEETFYDNKDLCILITDKNIKYKKELFA